jgi:hypothetical protein
MRLFQNKEFPQKGLFDGVRIEQLDIWQRIQGLNCR